MRPRPPARSPSCPVPLWCSCSASCLHEREPPAKWCRPAYNPGIPDARATPTALLLAWNAGDAGARDALLPLVYDELHRLAARYLRRERQHHTLQPTALVNEAYLRLVEGQQ